MSLREARYVEKGRWHAVMIEQNDKLSAQLAAKHAYAAMRAVHIGALTADDVGGSIAYRIAWAHDPMRQEP